MADNIKLQVDLEPQIKNLQELEKQMTDAVKKIGDQKVATKLTADLQNIRNQITSIQNVVNSPKGFDASIVNRNIGSVLKSIRNLGEELTEAFGGPSSDAVKKLEAQIAKMDDEIKKSQARLAQYKQVLGKTTAGEVGLKEGYYKSKLREADLHGFNQDTTIRKTAIASEEQLYKVKTSLENRKDLTPEMQKMIDAINRFIAEMEKTKQENIKEYNQEVQNQQNLQAQRDNLTQQREAEIEHMKSNAVDSSKLSVDQATIAKLNVDILTAQTTNEGIAKTLKGNKGTSGNDKSTDLDVVDQIAGADVATKSLNKNTGILSGSVGKAVKNFTSYTIVLGTLRRVARSVIQTIRQLDKALTEQAMVSGKTRQQTYALLKSYQNIAMQSGATTKEVAGVATQYFRQGKTAQEALTLTEAAVKAAKVASISTAESVDYLTTAINGFKLSAKDAMTVSDRFSALAAQSATSYEELAIALSKVASQANLAGMSMDYTLGLLAKGIETTREAPETIGTALKTVIARMREIKDYGETLEGDATVNNVEEQLRYIGIALRNQAGELRSTEDVLDELGQKWDTLTSNQQAAIAKALAGTRQQSRLISMMQDYSRTMELVQISERSAGATAAQSDTYMQGMEASLNKITVAWEKFVTAFTKDGSLILEILNTFGDALNRMAEFGDTLAGQNTIYAGLALAIASLIVKKVALASASNTEEKALKKERIEALKLAVAQADAAIAAQKEVVAKIKNTKQTLENAKARIKAAKAAIFEAKSKTENQQYLALYAQMEAQANERISEINKDLSETNAQLATEEANLTAQQVERNKYRKEELTLTASLKTGILQYIPIIGTLITTVTSLGISVKMAFEEGATAAMKFQAALGVIGVVLGVLGAILTVVVPLLSQLGGKTKEQEIADTTEQVRKLNTEITRINQSSTAIETAITKFENLDEKVIKTAEDVEDMKKVLDTAADKLTEYEQEQYNLLSTNEDRVKFLKEVLALNEASANAAKMQAINLLKSSQYQEDLLKNASNIAIVQDLVRDQLYDTVEKRAKDLDLTEEEERQMRSIASTIASNYDAKTALSSFSGEAFKNSFASKEEAKAYFAKYDLSIDNDIAKALKNGDKTLLDLEDYFVQQGKGDQYKKMLEDFAVKSTLNTTQLVETFQQTLLSDGETTILAAMSSGDTLISKFIEASKAVFNSDLPKNIKEAWKKSDIGQLGEQVIELFDGVSQEVIDRFDEYGLGPNLIAKYLNNFKDFGLGGDQTVSLLNMILDKKSIDEIVDGFDIAEDKMDEFKASVQRTREAIGGGGINTWSQEFTKLQNAISNAYETQAKWMDMTAEEQNQYLTSHWALANTEGFVDALRSGSSEAMKKVLQAAYEEQRQALLKQIDFNIQVLEETTDEEQKVAAQAQKQLLLNYKKSLENTEELYADSLENIIKKENSYIEKYKDFLQKQTDETVKALEKRKEAYEEYFDAINQAYEDQDWMSQQELLINNITKLSGATDATSVNKMAALQQTLQNNLKERQQELRERAQEALVNNIDKQIDEVNETLDNMLENSQALLLALTGEHGLEILNKMTEAMQNNIGLTEHEKVQRTWELVQDAAALGVGGLSLEPEVENNNGTVNNTNNVVINGITITRSQEEIETGVQALGISEAMTQNGQSVV